MKFEYTGRHVKCRPQSGVTWRNISRNSITFLTGPTLSTHVIIEVEKNRQIGEIVVYWRDHTLTAKDTNADMYMALTRAMAKIEKQAVKLKKKIIDRKQSEHDQPRAWRRNLMDILKPRRGRRASFAARRYSVKPMTLKRPRCVCQVNRISFWCFAMLTQSVSA